MTERGTERGRGRGRLTMALASFALALATTACAQWIMTSGPSRVLGVVVALLAWAVVLVATRRGSVWGEALVTLYAAATIVGGIVALTRVRLATGTAAILVFLVVVASAGLLLLRSGPAQQELRRRRGHDVA